MKRVDVPPSPPVASTRRGRSRQLGEGPRDVPGAMGMGSVGKGRRYRSMASGVDDMYEFRGEKYVAKGGGIS